MIVNPNWDRVSETLARHGVSADAAGLAAAEPRAKRRLDDPASIAATDDASRGWLYFDLVLAEAGLAPPPAALHAAWSELRSYHASSNLWESVPPDVPAALDAFRRAGLRLVVVSNANGTLRDHLARLGLVSFFDLVLDSAEVGIEKPDPRLFQFALQRAGARPEATVHVGDLYHVDVVGARAAGLRAVLLDSADLYTDRDCLRIASLRALVEPLLSRSR